ncbi:cytochrome c biogenesis protein CcdA [Candidatus Berkelbacteria bacterium]|nr:cytochrome c biogenesis protein CcdA [Candidatus Berkelbacteria bacterium]
MDIALIFSSFIAGILTFFAPCTLPLVPGYLALIAGARPADLVASQPLPAVRKKIFWNGVAFVIGFSVVFIALGTLFGIVGVALAAYRIWLARIGGLIVIFFGLSMMPLFYGRLFGFLSREWRINPTRYLKPGSAVSSLAFGAAFATGWTPCVGPILGSILLLVASSATVAKGALLLAIFSAGLAIPFLIVASSIGWFIEVIPKLGRALGLFEYASGALLVLLGVLLSTNRFAVIISFGYRALQFIHYDKILNYL